MRTCASASAGLPAAAREAERERLAAEESRRPFDLAHGPLLRAALLRLGPEDHALLLTLHHVISDGWSMGVLMREVTALYAAAVAGRPLGEVLPPLPVNAPRTTATLVVEPTLCTRNVPFCTMSS